MRTHLRPLITACLGLAVLAPDTSLQAQDKKNLVESIDRRGEAT